MLPLIRLFFYLPVNLPVTPGRGMRRNNGGLINPNGRVIYMKIHDALRARFFIAIRRASLGAAELASL